MQKIIILRGATWETRQTVIPHGVSIVFSPINIQLFLYNRHVDVNKGEPIIFIIKFPEAV